MEPTARFGLTPFLLKTGGQLPLVTNLAAPRSCFLVVTKTNKPSPPQLLGTFPSPMISLGGEINLEPRRAGGDCQIMIPFNLKIRLRYTLNRILSLKRTFHFPNPSVPNYCQLQSAQVFSKESALTSRGEGTGRELNPLCELPSACKRLSLYNSFTGGAPESTWWKDPYFQCLHIQYKNLLFFIFKGVVICNVVQMRPRTRVRIQNPAVPDSPQLSNTQIRTHTHT